MLYKERVATISYHLRCTTKAVSLRKVKLHFSNGERIRKTMAAGTVTVFHEAI